MAPSRADPWQPLSCPSRSTLGPGWTSRLSMLLLVVAGLLTSQVGLCASDTSTDEQQSVTWIYPKGGEVFHQLDTVNVSYQSSYPEPWLYTFCYQNTTANTVRQINMQEAGPYDASMLILMNFTTFTSCWFNLRDNTKSNTGSNSEKWALRRISRQFGPITTGATVLSTASATPLPSSSSTAAVARASSNNDDLSAGAKAGLGIGIGIGTSLLCAGAFWLYYRHVKRKEHHQEVYRRIVGEHLGGGAAGPGGQDAFAAPGEHLEPWRYGGTPQPAPSATGSAYSGRSDHSSDWYPSQATPSAASYQYYDPVGGNNYQTAAVGGGGGGWEYQPAPPSVLTTTASMNAEPRPPPAPALNNPRPEHVPDAAAIRDVQDLSSSLYPSEYNNNGNNNERPVSPVSAERTDIPPARLASVNYGPMGRLDASTGADFTLLPDYTSPPPGGGGGGGRQHQHEAEDDIYGPSTPRSPPPPHSAHAHVTSAHTLQQQQQQQQQQQPLYQHHQPYAPQEHAWKPNPNSARTDVVELPTAQTHQGYGPQAELSAGEGVPPPLRQQRSDLRGPEQKVLLGDVAPRRLEQHPRDGG